MKTKAYALTEIKYYLSITSYFQKPKTGISSILDKNNEKRFFPRILMHEYSKYKFKSRAHPTFDFK
jgi:hypothetical protein